MSHPLIDGLATSPDVFIHQLDVAGDRALLVRINAEQRRKASFLDDRILGSGVEGGWAAWPEIEPAARRAPAATPSFIFHIGHCGSTLISRLIEEATGVRSLREPNAVRTLAIIADDVADGLSLWNAETFRDRLALYLNTASSGAPTVIKATSWCGDLVNRTQGPALFCHSKPNAYIATMLGGANNSVDLKLNAAIRLRRLRRLCGDPHLSDVAKLSPGELAAMSWAAEAATMAAASAKDGARLHGIEFDSFLDDAEKTLAAAVAHLSLSSSAERINRALAGPLMRTYSKDASFDYSPDDRRMLLAEYATAHKDEIARGLRWLNAAAKAHPPIAAGLARFG